MKIGIVTLPGSFNYGNRLQLFATETAYRKLGCLVDGIELLIPPILQRASNSLNRIRGTFDRPELIMSQSRLAAFEDFNSKLSLRKVDLLNRGFIKEYQFFSVGSDQVWNPDYYGKKHYWYFLKFARAEQRIALAPSIGCDELTSRQGRAIARGIKGFSRLSVRERRGAELINRYTGRTAEVICDPTLTISAYEWRKVSSNYLTPSTSYIFKYLLGGETDESKRVENVVTQGGSLPVISLSDRQKPYELDAGPAEFVDLIDHAAHVITDSFHASVFSCIFHTPLTIVQRRGNASMFSRLEQLANMLHIQNKIYSSSDFDLSHSGDFGGVSELIDKEKAKFREYLEGCLNA